MFLATLFMIFTFCEILWLKCRHNIIVGLQRKVSSAKTRLHSEISIYNLERHDLVWERNLIVSSDFYAYSGTYSVLLFYKLYIWFELSHFFHRKKSLHKKMKFSIKDFFSKCDHNCESYLQKKSLMKNFIFCAASILSVIKWEHYFLN